MRIGEELHREFNDRARRLAVLVQGRVIYETMESFWPQAADDGTLSDFLREYGRIWTGAPKVLVSNTRREARHGTRIVGGDDALDQLARLRDDTDRVGEGVNSNHMAVVSSDARKIYVVASAKDAVVVVDAQTLSVLTTISTGAHPTHASVCPGCSETGGDQLWLVNEGHAHDGESAEPGAPHVGSISVIDMQTDLVTDTLVDTSFVVPHFVRFSAGSAYVPSIGGNQITVIDVGTRRVSDVLVLEGANAPGPCSGDPCGFADAQIDQNGLLVSAHIESGQVLVYDTLAHQRKQDILGGSRPWAVFVDLEDNSFDTYLMPNWDDSSVSLIDRKLHAEVARSLEGDQESYGVNYSRLAPGEAFVLNRQKERVAVIDRQTGASIDSLAVGGTTETASTTADGRYLLLPLSSTNQFAIWDIVQREEVARFEGVGEYPWSVATPE